jgi:hypothetical protein
MKKLSTDLQTISKEIKGVTKDTEILMRAVLRSLKTLSKKTEKAVKTASALEKAMEAKKKEAEKKKGRKKSVGK